MDSSRREHLLKVWKGDERFVDFMCEHGEYPTSKYDFSDEMKDALKKARCQFPDEDWEGLYRREEHIEKFISLKLFGDAEIQLLKEQEEDLSERQMAWVEALSLWNEQELKAKYGIKMSNV